MRYIDRQRISTEAPPTVDLCAYHCSKHMRGLCSDCLPIRGVTKPALDGDAIAKLVAKGLGRIVHDDNLHICVGNVCTYEHVLLCFCVCVCGGDGGCDGSKCLHMVLHDSDVHVCASGVYIYEYIFVASCVEVAKGLRNILCK